MPYAPPEYAQFANLPVGKPLALVNVGLSLELASPSMESQTTLPPSSEIQPADLLEYEFLMKIRDAARPFDGVVGYFDSNNSGEGATKWEQLFTYFVHDDAETVKPGDPRVMIEPDTPPAPQPYYIDPDEGNYAAQQTAKLQLPARTVRSALMEMRAFFKLDPLMVTQDVPSSYDITGAITADNLIDEQQSHIPGPAAAAVRLPLKICKGKGAWTWLQQYVTGAGGDGNPEDTSFNQLILMLMVSFPDRPPPTTTLVLAFIRPLKAQLTDLICAQMAALNWIQGPCTFIEGFVQLGQPSQHIEYNGQ
ncbi:hypothetical protein LTR44_011365 [Exophiala sp. CCFEE 6388]|uniref:Uncharacterized protein n=1 Tax=Exophiala sideris TaxID=1016849 RepID=A0ABR0IV30_9EURO|nr:hypothetical protein LTR69_011392 [Exophiala sideris]KAK5176090.1 hypothetical protein LTR44_011365 [Eurotiomycetes sp. CCFEE 6388]